MDELIEKSGNSKWVWLFATINNWMMVATGVANCIFAGTISMTAVLFFDWASCNMGWSGVCGNRWWTHLIAFVFVIPLCTPSKFGIFAATSIFASVIIFFTVNLIMGYQYGQIMEKGINNSVHWFKPLQLGQFYGVASFSIEGIGLILPIRSTMKKHHSFRWLLHTCGSLIVVLYFFFGTSGALVNYSHRSFLARKYQASFCSPIRRVCRLSTYSHSSIHWRYSWASQWSYFQFANLSLEVKLLKIFSEMRYLLLIYLVWKELSTRRGVQSCKYHPVFLSKSHRHPYHRLYPPFRIIAKQSCRVCLSSSVDINQIIFYINYFEQKGEISATHKTVLMSLLAVGVIMAILSTIDGIISIATVRHN